MSTVPSSEVDGSRLTHITSALSKDGDSDKMEIGSSEGVPILCMYMCVYVRAYVCVCMCGCVYSTNPNF